MAAPTPPRSAPAVPTGGAWLGFGVAARAALSVASAMSGIAIVAGVRVFADLFWTNADRDIRPQIGRMLDLMLELAAILAPYARIAGGSGVLLGFALFAASAMLVRGSETARRTTRALLVVEAVHSLAAAAWITVLSCTALAQWHERYQAAVAELIEAGAGRGGWMPRILHLPAWTNAVFYGAWGAASATVVVVLWWLAGRPFARDWCAARGAKSPVATAGPRR